MKRAQDPPVAAFKPGLTSSDAGALRAAIASGWAGSGIYVRLFERRVARAAGAARALAVVSGTAAVHLALEASGVSGGEVITTPLSSPATAHAILYARATPVFCDVDEETGNLDPRRVEEALGPRTRAILAVHFNGQPCEMDALAALARRRKVPLIEDAGAAVSGSGSYRGRPLGSLGDLGCFSFGRKNLTTLDGGAVAHGPRCRARLERLRNLGQEEGASAGERSRAMAELGYPYRMNDLAAAIGLAQFERWKATAARLAGLDRFYREGLRGAAALEPPAEREHARRSLSCFPVRVRAGRKPAFRALLSKRGIHTDDWLFPLHRLPLYRPLGRRLPVAEGLADELVYLPFYPGLTGAEARRVVSAACAFKG